MFCIERENKEDDKNKSLFSVIDEMITRRGCEKIDNVPEFKFFLNSGHLLFFHSLEATDREFVVLNNSPLME
jgi:hypothetical protein